MRSDAQGGVLGIVLDGSTATAAWRMGAADAWRTMAVPCDATPAAVVSAFADLAQSGIMATRVRVTLMRPLAHARVLAFPRMGRATLERVLERDWARYVIGLWPTPHTVAARALALGKWRAVFAPTETLEAIAHAATELGWRDVVVQMSDDVLAAVVGRTAATGTAAVIICDDHGPTDGVIVRQGIPVQGRRFPRYADTEAATVFLQAAANGSANTRPGVVVVMGNPARATAIAGLIRQRGYDARTLHHGGEVQATVEATLAIAGALGDAGIVLQSPSIRQMAAQRMSRVTGGLLAAAAVAVLLAFVTERVILNASLADVQRQRADIASAVRSAMSVRRTLDETTDMVSVLAIRETRVSRATTMIAAIAGALPAGTALTSLNVNGDSVTIEGESERSAAVYEALRALPQLERVRLAAPLRQDRLAGNVPVERFSFGALVRDSKARAGAPR